MEFREFPKIPRLSRACTITEKIDGTNASVLVTDNFNLSNIVTAIVNGFGIFAGSRTHWITPENDNHGFAHWVYDHADELVLLGPGHHFGEWWGKGINRGYGLTEKRFSLFNTGRWRDPKIVGMGEAMPLDNGAWCPPCCHVVPLLYEGLFSTWEVNDALANLNFNGSVVAPGFMNPEGIVVYHHAANMMFKKTIVGDEEGKHAEAHPKKVKLPRPPKDPSKGGRRIGQMAYEGADKREAK